MTHKKEKPVQPDKALTAACGLFCPSCMVYIASRETPENREKIAQTIGLPADTLFCDGCRSDRRYVYCNSCKMIACVAEKGIDFCGQCNEYPCAELKKFQSEAPHRLELWDAQSRIKDKGWEKWFWEMLEHYSCSKCATINSAYNLACRKCGTFPGSDYARLHQNEMADFMAKWRKEPGKPKYLEPK
jgi:hypothetical protein